MKRGFRRLSPLPGPLRPKLTGRSPGPRRLPTTRKMPRPAIALRRAVRLLNPPRSVPPRKSGTIADALMRDLVSGAESGADPLFSPLASGAYHLRNHGSHVGRPALAVIPAEVEGR